jgi:hypothetical protein
MRTTGNRTTFAHTNKPPNDPGGVSCELKTRKSASIFFCRCFLLMLAG